MGALCSESESEAVSGLIQIVASFHKTIISIHIGSLPALAHRYRNELKTQQQTARPSSLRQESFRDPRNSRYETPRFWRFNNLS